MKKTTRPAALFLTATLAILASCTVKTEKGAPACQEKDKAAIEQLIDQYVETINRCDTALVNQIWSHDAKVSFIGPSGYYSTYQEVRDSLVVGVFSTGFKQRDLQKDDLKIDVNGNMAWSEFLWTFDAIRADGFAHHTRGRETQIFEKNANGQWRLVHIHYSAIR